MDKLEERMAKVEGILEQMDRRLNHLESFSRWMIGLLVSMWVTVTGLLVTMWVTRG